MRSGSRGAHRAIIISRTRRNSSNCSCPRRPLPLSVPGHQGTSLSGSASAHPALRRAACRGWRSSDRRCRQRLLLGAASGKLSRYLLLLTLPGAKTLFISPHDLGGSKAEEADQGLSLSRCATPSSGQKFQGSDFLCLFSSLGSCSSGSPYSAPPSPGEGARRAAPRRCQRSTEPRRSVRGAASLRTSLQMLPKLGLLVVHSVNTEQPGERACDFFSSPTRAKSKIC